MTETQVGTSELKNKLSKYTRRVKSGETIPVTEHGKTIGQKLPTYQPKAVNKGTGLVSDLVIEGCK